MHIGFVRLADLYSMYSVLGPRFFDSNIRYGLGEGEAVNRAISNALRKILVDGTEEPSVFTFDHNGITLYAERFDIGDGQFTLVEPRLLNGAQTVTTVAEFINKKNKGNAKLKNGKHGLESVRVLCKIITDADQKFVTQVTINNNRQNPVEPWNLHANDLIQLQMQEKFADDLHIFYERQENAFDQLSPEDLEEYGVTEDAKAIQMLKLTQTFLLTDGFISRLSEMRKVFEDRTFITRYFEVLGSRQILGTFCCVTRFSFSCDGMPKRFSRKARASTGSFRVPDIFSGRCYAKGFLTTKCWKR
jgi:hypothetical protein